MSSSTSLAEELRLRHVVVVKTTSPHLAELRARFERALVDESPEFARHPTIAEVRREFAQGEIARYGVGGTSFLGHPSVFHAPSLRLLRRQVYHVLLVEVFAEYLRGRPDLGVEMLLDRIMVRPAGDSPAAETWHRDISPYARPDEEVFGGWLNLDDAPQYFSCVPGSALGRVGSGLGSGLGFVPAEEEGGAERIAVPPGALILFREDILHQVLATPTRRPSARLFHAFRVSPHLGESMTRLEDLDSQSVPRIKSGQLPVAYPASATRFPLQAERVVRWKAEMLTDPRGQIDPKTRAFLPLPPALRHPKWTAREKSALKVARVFHLPDLEGRNHKLSLPP